MAAELKGRRVAALVTHGFEQSELLEPKRALEAAGARVDIIAPEPGTVRGWSHKEWGETQPVDRTLDDARVDDYDAVLLPGGVMNPDALRMQPAAVAFVRTAFEDGKPIAAICHGPWTLVEAGVVDGVRMTSWPSLKTDLRNAGAEWVDAEVVVDRGIVSSRQPADIPAFNRKMIEEFVEGRHGGNGERRPAAGTPQHREAGTSARHH
jgi:protease I